MLSRGGARCAGFRPALVFALIRGHDCILNRPSDVDEDVDLIIVLLASKRPRDSRRPGLYRRSIRNQLSGLGH
jgi:hypothetical protein